MIQLDVHPYAMDEMKNKTKASLLLNGSESHSNE